MAAPEPAAPELLSPEAVRQHEPALVVLLQNVVDDGASIGFLPPLSTHEATRYWQSVAAAMREKRRVLWITRGSGGAVTGSVQLDLEPRPNGSHRAEVMKLMVLTSARRGGLGRALMRAAEEGARRLGRTTLFLDTRRGDPSERLYESLGWVFAGSIPEYARSANGALDANAIYYRLLDK
jgi:ribosomal protein S18 acetylase RimI-like enzyme